MEPQGQTPRSLQDLVAALVQSRERDVPSVQAFPPVDPEAVAHDLNLYVRAAEAGQHDQPPSNAVAPDAAEQEIGAAIEGRARAALDEYRAQLDLHDTRIRSAIITDPERLAIEAAVKGVVAELEARISDSLDQLHDVWRETVEDVETQFQAFRSHHGLTRLPKIVSRGGKLIRGLMLATFVMLATILNGSFLAEGSDETIGWTVQALAWALLNVVTAASYARNTLPRIVSRGFGSKLVGAASTCVFLAWVLGLNVLTGHFRDVFVAHESKVTIAELWRHLALGPLVLDDSKSWLLSALGLGLSAISVMVAAGMDDLYPGYGALGRRRAAAMEAYKKEASSCSERLTAVRDAAVEDIRAAIEAMRNLEYQSNVATDARSRFHLQFLEYLDHLAAIHEQLCKRYREVNEAVRSGTVPKYFRRKVQRPALIEPPDLPALAQLPQGAWAQAIARMEHHIATVNNAFATTLPRAQEVEEPTPDPVEVGVTV